MHASCSPSSCSKSHAWSYTCERRHKPNVAIGLWLQHLWGSVTKRKEGRKQERKQERKKGRKKGRKEGWKDGIEGRMEERKEGRTEGKKEASKEGRKGVHQRVVSRRRHKHRVWCIGCK